MNIYKLNNKTTAASYLVLILSISLIPSVINVPIGPFIKVCSSRELKLVIESICSTFARRSGWLPPPQISEPIRIVKRNTSPEMPHASVAKRSK